MELIIDIRRSVEMTKYELPDVWQWEEENSNRGGNRPTAGERFE